MTQIDWRRVRLLGVASLIVLVPAVLVAVWALGPIVMSLDEVSQDAVLVRHLTTLAAEKPGYLAALARAQAILGNQTLLFQGGAAELESAQLQNTVQGLISQAGGQLSSSAIDAPQTTHGLEALAVSVSFSLPQDQLAQLLSAIDTQAPYLIVQALDIHATDNGNGQALLNVQMQVGGFGSAT